MAPKFAVGKQVIGIKGQHTAHVGTITNRIKIGNKNFLDIRWHIGGEQRLTTAFVDLYEAGPVNNVDVDRVGVGVAAEIVNRAVPEDVEEELSGSESSNDSEEEHMGDLDGYKCVFF
jgi:hypothetical protein